MQKLFIREALPGVSLVLRAAIADMFGSQVLRS